MDSTPELTSVAPDFLSDCRLMLRFARKMGTDLSPELEHRIASLDTVLKSQSLAPISDVPAVLVPEPGTDAKPPVAAPELVLQIHKELSGVVAPATALSLQSSEPPPGRHTFVGGMPLVVKWAAALALLSALGFVVSAGFLAISKPVLAAVAPAASAASAAR